jgi:phosphohistidine phosphatase
MKLLTIVRHAKSRSAEAGLNDFERPLSERGWKSARRIGENFKRRRQSFGLILASPAIRVCQTLEGIAATYGELSITFKDDLYLATERALLDFIRAAPDDVRSLLLVGHNPGIERFVADLARDDELGLRSRVIAKFSTATVAVLKLLIDRWADVRPGSATLAKVFVLSELD